MIRSQPFAEGERCLSRLFLPCRSGQYQIEAVVVRAPRKALWAKLMHLSGSELARMRRGQKNRRCVAYVIIDNTDLTSRDTVNRTEPSGQNTIVLLS